MSDITLSILEMFVGLVIESTLLAGVFAYLSNRANEKQEQKLQNEMNKIEKQNRFNFEQLQTKIQQSRTDLLNQMKEAQQSHTIHISETQQQKKG